MKKIYKIIFLFVLVLTSCHAYAYQGYPSTTTAKSKDIKVELLPDLICNSKFGCLYRRIKITNSTSVDHVVTISAKEQYGENYLATKNFEIPHGLTKTVTFNLPAQIISSPNRDVVFYVKDDTSGNIYSIGTVQGHNKKERPLCSILLDSALPAGLVGASVCPELWNETGIMTPSEVRGRIKFGLLKVNKNELDFGLQDTSVFSDFYESWLGYLQFDAIYFFGRTLKALSASQQKALYDYVRAGGFLIVFGGDIKLPEDFIKTKTGEHYNLTAGGMGLCLYIDVNDEMVLEATKVEASHPKIDKDDIDFEGSDEEKGKEKDIDGDVYKPEYEYTDKDEKSDFFMSSEISEYISDRITPRDCESLSLFDLSSSEDGFSTAVFSTIILLITGILGPLSIRMVLKSGKMASIFIIVPGLSFLICSVLLVVHIIYEKTSTRLTKSTVIYTDETTNNTVVSSNIGIYSISNIGYCLEAPLESAVMCVNRKDKFGKIELDSSQRFVKDWVKSRINTEFRVIDLLTNFSRVTFNVENGNAKLLNGLGTNIKWILYKDEYGRLYSGGNIYSGQSHKLRPIQSDRPIGNRNLNDILFLNDCDRGQAIRNIVKKQPGCLMKNQYVAEIESSQFLKQSLENYARLDESAYIVGNVKGGTGI